MSTAKTLRLTKNVLIVVLIASGNQGCQTYYRDSSVPLMPEYVSEATIKWCKECPIYVREDLADCQMMANKLDYRNNLDENNIITAPDVSWISLLKFW